MKRLLLPLLILLPFTAQAACPVPGAEITVRREDPEPTLAAAPMLALRTQMADAQGAHGQHLGVTSSRVEWRTELSARYLRQPNGTVCAVPDRIAIELVHVEHAIRIAEEIPRDGCLWREVLAHERRHVAVNSATLRETEQAVGRAVRHWSRSAVARAANAEAATAVLQASLRRAVEPSLAAMRRARARGHGRIDSPAEYDRLARICPAEQRLLPPMR
ncbi:hypothetical protein [Plastoroseomonas hellenica]|uniref:DUF922 domain-containing protein n=1 Tax=Plastoroseomonas hellenica TaxID=2687306 RepID=A0ABS5F761_9PROT|nr:hypothetical protein [Plastoroseomonas hellenica]MBR0646587.1 hypothetical protein [Plastoroseomonas hellenica]MBR0668407.1 hypothetical protein [Plastoroseomonas hellenica]